jgi:hypothetical protein
MMILVNDNTNLSNWPPSPQLISSLDLGEIWQSARQRTSYQHRTLPSSRQLMSYQHLTLLSARLQSSRLLDNSLHDNCSRCQHRTPSRCLLLPPDCHERNCTLRCEILINANSDIMCINLLMMPLVFLGSSY